MNKRKIGRWIALAAAIVVLVPVVLFLKQYYDNRYALDDVYYTVVPLDYDITPYDDEQGGRMKDYVLTCYNADGEARELEFTVFIDAHGANLYPPGTFLKVRVSRQLVLDCYALDVADVPLGALERIRITFQPTTATSLVAYAQERSSQLSAIDTPSLQASCAAEGTTLVYTYRYNAAAKELAEAEASLLDPVYLAQFRADSEAFPELTAIALEVKLDDGTVVFSQSYDTRIEFTYEMA